MSVLLKMVLGMNVIILNYFGGYSKVILTKSVVFFVASRCVTFPIETIMIPKNFCSNKFGQTKALALIVHHTHTAWGFGGVKRFSILVVSSFSLRVRSFGSDRFYFGFVVAVGH